MIKCTLNKYSHMKPWVISMIVIAGFAFGCDNEIKPENPKPPRYSAIWDSLAQYNEAPQWFREGKFGIYAHWGVLSVPEYGNDWYPRNMHIEGTNENKYQVETYGNLSEFGYHDFVPHFKAEKFNAEEWAELFKKAGAQFAGVVAQHHDGWSNWDSEINPWNSMDKGPKKDLLGALEKAIHGNDMKFVTSFHKARNLQIFKNDSTKWLDDTSYFPYSPKTATSSQDSVLSIMYGNIPKERFYKNWLGELKEVIDHYHPDLIYFDSKLDKIPEEYKTEFAAYYINESLARDQEVVITHKEGELPKSVSLEDYEKGRANEIKEEFWLTDETVTTGSWSYVKGLQYKTANDIVDVLADIVSKNGALMLNISPKASGEIPEEQKTILLEIGQWLDKNGEAIYATSPWLVFGEGPTKQEKEGMFLDWITYSGEDIRYTKKGKVVYAIVLGQPTGDNIILKSFGQEKVEDIGKIDEITVLETGEIIPFKLMKNGLYLATPKIKVDDKAFVYQLIFED